MCSKKILSITFLITFAIKMHESSICRSLEAFPDQIHCGSALQITTQSITSPNSLFCKLMLRSFCRSNFANSPKSCNLLFDSRFSNNLAPISTLSGIGQRIKNAIKAFCVRNHSPASNHWELGAFHRMTGGI